MGLAGLKGVDVSALTSSFPCDLLVLALAPCFGLRPAAPSAAATNQAASTSCTRAYLWLSSYGAHTLVEVNSLKVASLSCGSRHCVSLV